MIRIITSLSCLMLSGCVTLTATYPVGDGKAYASYTDGTYSIGYKGQLPVPKKRGSSSKGIIPLSLTRTK